MRAMLGVIKKIENLHRHHHTWQEGWGHYSDGVRPWLVYHEYNGMIKEKFTVLSSKFEKKIKEVLLKLPQPTSRCVGPLAKINKPMAQLTINIIIVVVVVVVVVDITMNKSCSDFTKILTKYISEGTNHQG